MNFRKLRRKRVWIPSAAFLLLAAFFIFVNVAMQFGAVVDGNQYVGRAQVLAETVSGPLNVSYLHRGNKAGRRIIFVHGTPGSAADFYQFVRNAPEDLEVIAIDRAGFGQTLPYVAVTSLEAQADALLPLLVERDGKKPILVGHSLGGPIVAKVAAKYGDKIGGMIQLAGSLDPALEEVLFIQHVGNVWPISWLIPTIADHSNQELIYLEAELRQLKTELHSITTPTIIIHGTADNLVPYSNVAYMKTEFTRAQIVDVITLEGQNHFLPWQRQTVIAQAIRKLADETYTLALDQVRDDTASWPPAAETWAELSPPDEK